MFDPLVGKIPRRRAWHPIPVFLPGESHGQRSLAATVHWTSELATTEATSHARIQYFHFNIYFICLDCDDNYYNIIIIIMIIVD